MPTKVTKVKVEMEIEFMQIINTDEPINPDEVLDELHMDVNKYSDLEERGISFHGKKVLKRKIIGVRYF